MFHRFMFHRLSANSRPDKLLPGDLVEVRSSSEILSTLDLKGCLENLPFMPEMFAFCGRQFRFPASVQDVRG